MPFADIIGNREQIVYFQRVLELGTTAHAYVFLGPQAVGKMAIAQRFAAALLNTEPHRLSLHPDVMLVTRPSDEKTEAHKQQIPIEAIRAATDRLALSAIGGRKIVIIDEADTMTVQAQNALLKTLEEPSGQAVLILIAEDRSRLLPTILSRSVPMTFHRLPTHALVQALLERGYARTVAETAAEHALGRPGAAVRLADADTLMEMRQQLAEVGHFLDAPRHERMRLVTSFAKGDDAKHADDVQAWLFDVCSVMHARLLTGDLRMEIALSAVLEARDALRHNGNAVLALEHVALALP
jgi:DNA polymerase III subunit delta'